MAKRRVHDAAVPLPDLIRGYRRARDLNQTDFAELVGIGPAMIGHVEAGRRSLSVANVEKITAALDLDAPGAAELRRARDAASGVTPQRERYATVEMAQEGISQLRELTDRVLRLEAVVDQLLAAAREQPG